MFESAASSFNVGSSKFFDLRKIFLAISILLVGFVLWRSLVEFWKFYMMIRKFNRLPVFPSLGLMNFFFGNLEVFFHWFYYLTPARGAYNLLLMMNKLTEFKEKGMVAAKFGPTNILLVFDQKTAESIITSSVNIKKSYQYGFFKSWLGSGLLTSFGNHWRHNRKLLTPAFHFKILESFIPIMNEDVQTLVAKIEAQINGNGEEMAQDGIDVRPMITSCTLDTICATAMGVKIGAQKNTGNTQYVQSILSNLKLLIERILNPLYYLQLTYLLTSSGRSYSRNIRRVNRFVKTVINNRREEIRKSIVEKKIDLNQIDSDDVGFLSRKRYAFLDSLLLMHIQNPKDFTMKDILDEVNTFMFEGHDTTSTSLIYNTLMIASDQRVQAKLHEEMDSIFGSDVSRPITSEDCRQMKYLEMCIKEALRLYPSVPFIGREVVEDFEIDGQIVPKGCTVAVIFFMLHRNSEIFPQPERFIPERFEPDQPIHKMPYAYMPFSAGPRNCIGQKFAMTEMKILLASIFRRFKLTNISLHDEVKNELSIIIKPDSPVNIRFEFRHHDHNHNH